MKEEDSGNSDIELGLKYDATIHYDVTDENDVSAELKNVAQHDNVESGPVLRRMLSRSNSMSGSKSFKVVKRRSVVFKDEIKSSNSFQSNLSQRRISQAQNKVQYRIQKKIKVEHASFFNKFKHFLGCWKGSTQFDAFNFDDEIGESQFCCHCDITRVLVTYLSWSFRTSFAILFLQLSIVFFAFIGLFTFIIAAIGSLYPTCFQPVYGSGNTPMADAYALSWTTFTTVGYGHIYPSLGVENNNQGECSLLFLLCTFEAFVGVIWAGFSGAIIFSKVVKIRSLAPIFFSDPITIRYGTGISESQNVPEGKLPFPVLTFRLVNLHNDRAGGELVDSRINVLAMFNEQENCVKPKNPPRKKQRTGLRKLKSSYEAQTSHRNMIVINEEGESGLCSQSHFYKIKVDTNDNPYFKRSWTVNHVLDQFSPLIVPDVQRAIRNNDGYWPDHINDAESIRRSIKFDQIFVSLSGVSVASADSVYAQHMYDYVDMNVGYKFVPLLYKDEHDDIKVTFEFLNDVVEQGGGGAEQFITENDEQSDHDSWL